MSEARGANALVHRSTEDRFPSRVISPKARTFSAFDHGRE